METLYIIVAVSLLFMYVHFFGGKAPKPYQNRKCTGKQWKSAFPLIKSKDIRRFLFLWVDAFALNDDQKLKFEPNDKIMDVYKSVAGSLDSMELETLAIHLEEEYSMQLEQLWHENLTLGELFQFTLNAQKDTKD